MGRKIEITLVPPSDSEEEEDVSKSRVHNVKAIAHDQPQRLHRKGNQDQQLIPYYAQHPLMNRDQKMTLDGKLFRYVRGSEHPDTPHVQIGATDPLPHSFDRLNYKHKQGTVSKEEARHWRYHDSISVEEFSTDLLKKKGVKFWIRELMKQLETDPGALKLIPNIAFEIVRNFPVVVFSNKGARSGRQVSKILEATQDKHNLKPETFLEIVIDDSRAGTKTYNDLVMITQMRGLPQIFIGETFIGGYDSLKKLKKFKKLGPMVLQSLGFNTWPCKLCEKEKEELGGVVKYPRDRDEEALERSHLYPGHVDKKAPKLKLKKDIYSKEKSHLFPSLFRRKVSYEA